MKLFKNFYLFICGILAMCKTSYAEFIDGKTKDRVLSTAFDSYDDEYDSEYYDDPNAEGYDEGDNIRGKKKRPSSRKNILGEAGGNTRWMATQGYFTINVTNLTVTDLKIELFSSLNNAVNSINTNIYPTFNPFTFTNRAAANANSTVVWAPNGDMVITNGAGLTLTINCADIAYRTLVESLKFYRIAVKTLKFGYTNVGQLNQKIVYRERTFLGKNNENSFTPKAFFKDDQYQGKQVTMNQPFVLDGERGLEYICTSGEVSDLTFTLDGICKNG